MPFWLTLWGLGGLAIWLMMTGLWLISVARRDASIVDAFWGPGFALAAGVYAVFGQGDPGRTALTLILTTVWAFRLGLYIYVRNHGHGEDRRYQAFRQHYGPTRYWWVSYFQVFMLQGVLMGLVSAPLLVSAGLPGPTAPTLPDLAGGVLWGIGFAFEAIGDWQLARFKADPANKGKVLDRGLWRYTRHPNYFGNACLWWGLYLLAVSVPWGWVTIFAPLLMTFLLVRVSGVALLEKSLEARPGYRDYVARTSAFFPLPPRKQ